MPVHLFLVHVQRPADLPDLAKNKNVRIADRLRDMLGGCNTRDEGANRGKIHPSQFYQWSCLLYQWSCFISSMVRKKL
jgi:hypothetical protein